MFDPTDPLRGPTGRLTRARRLLEQAERVLVLTGAGISAESGVPTFRDPMTGLWAHYRPEELATPQAFAHDPRLVWEWYEWRRAQLRECAPNPAHRALADWIAASPGGRRLYTQNVDGLHHRALEERDEPIPDGAHPRTLHGDLFGNRCSHCAWVERAREPLDTSSEHTLPRCPECGEAVRPAVVWFGEALDSDLLEQAMSDAQRADVCLVVGTSALVHPAASLPRIVDRSGGVIIEVNPQPTPLTAEAAVHIAGAAGAVLPELLM